MKRIANWMMAAAVAAIAAAPAGAEDFPLWVGSTQVTSANKTDILGDGTVWFDGTASGGTLVLSNATITASGVPADSRIDSANVFSGEGFDLTISLAGSNRVSNQGNMPNDYCVYAGENLAIAGGGTLVAEMVGQRACGIGVHANLRVVGATVTVSAYDTGLLCGRTLAISNATVTATSRSDYGINAEGSFVISGASVVTAVATNDGSRCAFKTGALVLDDGLAITEPAGGAFDADERTVLDPDTGARAKRVVIAPPTVYPLWVGGVQVCETNQNDILGDGTASFEGTATNGTLFLSNARITEAIEHPGINTANIWSDRGFDLTIQLAGSNRVESAESTSDDYCVWTEANLAITGEGTLVAEMTGENGCGIGAYDNLRIDGATVTVSAGDTGLSFGNTLAISNATVTATGTSSYGIYCSGMNGRIDIADSVVTATGGTEGLYARGTGSSLAVSGASVVTAVTTSDDNVAFSAAALVLGDGLAVTEPAGGVFGEDGWGSGCVIDPATGAPAKRVVIDRRFAVTVVDGLTTNTTARAGETVTVVANAPEEGHGFVQWSADDAMDLSFARADAATTTFAMPARAVTVTAVFKEIQIDSIPDQEWTGGPVEPEFRSDTVKFEGTDMVLLPGTDYTVSYTNNVDPGTATATVTMAPPRTGHASVTFRILPPPEPPAVSNVVARQRWPWNGLVDVDYEVGGYTEGLEVRISFAKQGDEGRPRVATRFLADAKPKAEPGRHRATWDAAADGAANFVASNLVATVALVEPDVWLLPRMYELYNGDIYLDGDKVRSADDVDTNLIVAPGDSCTCLLISSYEDANGDTRYKQIEATPAVAVESDEKDMFTTVADAGQVTVTVNDGAPIGPSAAISCSLAGCRMRNSLTVSTGAMRGIKLYLPESGRPQRYDENAWDVYARVVPFADNSREVEAGATYQKATLSNDRLDELLVRDFSYIQNGNTFVQNMYKLEASVPDPAAKVLVLFELRAKNAADGDWGFVMPAYMIDLSKSLYEEDRNYTENDYVPYDADYFFPLWTAEFNTNQTPFGTYKGNAKTKAFKVGDGVGFHTGRMTGSEGSGQGLWTIGVSHVRPLDAAVIEGGLDDGNMKAAGTGETCLLGSWYGVEGIVYPIHFTELSTNPSTYSAEPTLLSVTE